MNTENKVYNINYTENEDMDGGAWFSRRRQNFNRNVAAAAGVKAGVTAVTDGASYINNKADWDRASEIHNHVLGGKSVGAGAGVKCTTIPILIEHLIRKYLLSSGCTNNPDHNFDLITNTSKGQNFRDDDFKKIIHLKMMNWLDNTNLLDTNGNKFNNDLPDHGGLYNLDIGLIRYDESLDLDVNAFNRNRFNEILHCYKKKGNDVNEALKVSTEKYKYMTNKGKIVKTNLSRDTSTETYIRMSDYVNLIKDGSIDAVYLEENNINSGFKNKHNIIVAITNNMKLPIKIPLKMTSTTDYKKQCEAKDGDTKNQEPGKKFGLYDCYNTAYHEKKKDAAQGLGPMTDLQAQTQTQQGEENLASLEKQLEDALANKDYMEAAKIQGQIEEMKRQGASLPLLQQIPVQQIPVQQIPVQQIPVQQVQMVPVQMGGISDENDYLVKKQLGSKGFKKLKNGIRKLFDEFNESEQVNILKEKDNNLLEYMIWNYGLKQNN